MFVFMLYYKQNQCIIFMQYLECEHLCLVQWLKHNIVKKAKILKREINLYVDICIKVAKMSLWVNGPYTLSYLFNPDKIACLCYHCHSSTAPSYVTDMLHKKPLHTRNTRSSSYTMPLLNRPAHSKATLGDRSFSFASSSVWNSIPNDVKCAPSLSSFKSRLKTYLFCSVYKDWTASLITVHMCMVRPCHSFVDGLSKKCINVYFLKSLIN